MGVPFSVLLDRTRVPVNLGNIWYLSPGNCSNQTEFVQGVFQACLGQAWGGGFGIGVGGFGGVGVASYGWMWAWLVWRRFRYRDGGCVRA